MAPEPFGDRRWLGSNSCAVAGAGNRTPPAAKPTVRSDRVLTSETSPMTEAPPPPPDRLHPDKVLMFIVLPWPSG